MGQSPVSLVRLRQYCGASNVRHETLPIVGIGPTFRGSYPSLLSETSRASSSPRVALERAGRDHVLGPRLRSDRAAGQHLDVVVKRSGPRSTASRRRAMEPLHEAPLLAHFRASLSRATRLALGFWSVRSLAESQSYNSDYITTTEKSK